MSVFMLQLWEGNALTNAAEHHSVSEWDFQIVQVSCDRNVTCENHFPYITVPMVIQVVFLFITHDHFAYIQYLMHKDNLLVALSSCNKPYIVSV